MWLQVNASGQWMTEVYRHAQTIVNKNISSNNSKSKLRVSTLDETQCHTGGYDSIC
jgi:hypothetical protein